MKEIKCNIHWVASCILFLFSIINFVISACGYSWLPADYSYVMIIYAAIAAVYIVVSITLKKCQTAASKKIGRIIIFFGIVYFLSVCCFIESNSVYCKDIKYNEIFKPVLLGIIFLVWFVVYSVCCEKEWQRLFIALIEPFVITVLVINFGICLLFMPLDCMFMSDVTYSPDSKAYAYIAVDDEGALGQNTEVYIHELDKSCKTMIGTFMKRDKRIKCRLIRGAANRIEWDGNNTIIINGESYLISN